MNTASILDRLQTGIALAAFVLACALAIFMDSALRRSFEREDALVMEAQATALVQAFEGGLLSSSSGERQPEKADWRIMDRTGATVMESRGMASIPPMAWPAPGLPPRECAGPGGGTFSVATRRWHRSQESGLVVLAMDRTHEEALVRGFRRMLALGVIGLSLSAALVGRLIARWGLKPLHRIAQEAGQIRAKTLDRRLAPEAFPKELQELVATLNAALERLDSAFQRLERFGAELAHELRTPLQNLRSTMENLTLRGEASEAHLHTLGGLLEECDRMAATIEQILFLAHSEGVESPPDLREVNAQEAMGEAQAFFEPAAEEQGVTIKVECEQGLKLQAEPLLLLRALHNLVANALRHTPAGGTITLGGTRTPGADVLWVQDTGEGIPEAWQGKVTQAFIRGPGTENREGLGLGLAIVKRIAEMHRAELGLESQEGIGTRVELRFASTEPEVRP